MNIDTRQAFAHPTVGRMFRNYGGVPNVQREVGNKKTNDPQVWGASAESAHAGSRVDAAASLG